MTDAIAVRDQVRWRECPRGHWSGLTPFEAGTVTSLVGTQATVGFPARDQHGLPVPGESKELGLPLPELELWLRAEPSGMERTQCMLSLHPDTREFAVVSGSAGGMLMDIDIVDRCVFCGKETLVRR